MLGPRFLMLMNNDVFVYPGALALMHITFLTHPNVGVVVPKFLFVTRDKTRRKASSPIYFPRYLRETVMLPMQPPVQQVLDAGGICFSDSAGWQYGKHMDDDVARYQYTRDTDYGTAALALVRRAMIIEADMYDPRFRPAYYEVTPVYRTSPSIYVFVQASTCLCVFVACL